MSAGPFQIIMSVIGNMGDQLAAAAKAADDFSDAIALLDAAEIPDDVAEQSIAVCRECATATGGTWQHDLGGRRIRTPTEHAAPAGGTCPGSFRPADLEPKH